MADPIGALRVDLSANAAQFEKDMGRATRAVRSSATRMEKNLGRFNRAANDNVTSLTRMTGAATTLTRFVPALGVALSGVGLVNFAQDTVHATANLGNLANRLDVSAEKLQGWQHAADVSGSSAETLNKGLEKLQSNIGLAAQGTGPAVKAFDQLNISVRDAQGQVKSTERVLEEIIDRFQGVKTATELAALSGQLFGERYGRELILLLGQGNEAVQSLSNEIIKLSDGSAQAAIQLEDQWTTFSTNFSNAMKNAVLSVFEFMGVIDRSFAALDLPGKIAETQARIAELQSELAGAAANPELLGTMVLNVEPSVQSEELKRQEELLAKLQAQMDIQERLRGVTESAAQTDVVSTKQIDQVQSFINLQIKQIEHLELTREAMARGEASVQGLNDAIAIQDELISLGLIPANTSLVEAMQIAATSTDEQVTKVAGLVEQYREAQRSVDALAEAEQRQAEAARERSREIEQQVDLIKQNEQQQERLKKSLFDVDRIAVQAGSTVASSLASALVAGESLDDTFKNLISSLAEMVLRALLFQAIMSAIGAGGFGPGAGLFAKGGVVEPSAKGNVIPFARGGLITKPTIFPFKDGIGLAGEKGTEAIMPLMRDRSGRLGVSAEGMGGNGVQVINQIIVQNSTDANVSTETRTDSNGEEQIIIKVDRLLGSMASRGEGQLFRAIRRNFGANVQPVSR